MKRVRRESLLAGRVGVGRHLGRQWTGWSGHLAHPTAPQGGGGPGLFSQHQLEDEPAERPRPFQAQVELDSADAPVAPQPPPATVARSLGKLLEVSSKHVDVVIEAEILRDAGGGPEGSARTSCTHPAATAPAYKTDAEGKITRFEGKLRWKRKVSIQTRYGKGARAQDLSCYGRGTTVEDRRSGNVTLGFHEACHREDLVLYLQSHALPQPPSIAVGMSERDYTEQTEKFIKAIEQYWVDLEAFTHRRTDEVGHTKSEVERTGQCYVHQLP